MRAFFILFLLLSCSKTKYTALESVPVAESQFIWDETRLDRYSDRIDVLVAFLWPSRIETAEQKSGVRRVISRSRELRAFKKDFLSKRFKLEEDFKSQDCPCVLDGVCEGDETKDDLDLCLNLEEKKYAHQETLASFFVIVEDIRDSVEAIGGLWVKTNTEFPEAPLSVLDLKNRRLDLQVFDVDDVRFALRPELTLDFSGGFPALEWSMPIHGTVWEVEASLELQDHFLSGQGEITAGERKGIIYWEQSPR